MMVVKLMLILLLLSSLIGSTGYIADNQITAGMQTESEMMDSRLIFTDHSAIPADTSGDTAKVEIQTILGPKTFIGFSQYAYDGKIPWLAHSGCGVGAFLSAVGPFIPYFEDMDMQAFYEVVLETGTLGKISKSGSIGYGGMKKLIEEHSDGLSVEIIQDFEFNEACEDIKNHLYSGQPVIVTVMPVDRGATGKKDKKYTNTGRFMTLLGMTENGEVIAADCGSDKTWSFGGEKQLRIKYGNLQDIVNHMWPMSNYDVPGNWYTARGSNGYMKINIKRK